MSGKTTNSPWIMHTALAQISYNTTCDTETYMTPSNKAFNQKSDTATDGTDIGRIHMPNFEACIDHCATYINASDTCAAVVYQPTAADGFENCYLKATSHYAYARRGYKLAILATTTMTTNNATNTSTGTDSTSTSTSNSPSPSSQSTSSTNPGTKNNSWITAVVLSPLVVITVTISIGTFIHFRRHHHKKHDRSSQTEISEPHARYMRNVSVYPSILIGAGRSELEVDADSAPRLELEGKGGQV